MMQNRKCTAWRKNRKFGDIHGGRMRLRCTDGIFNRKHNLLPPTDGQEVPVYIRENTSGDFYFPVTMDEIKETIKQLPVEHTQFLTHIWLAKIKTKDYLNGKMPQGEFICGSGVYLIKLYAFPKNNRMTLGQNRPTTKQLNYFQKYCTDLRQDKYGWYLQWKEENVRNYFLEKLLLHEIGHCVDYVYKRYWSKANQKQVESFADNYAAVWSNNLKLIFEKDSIK